MCYGTRVVKTIKELEEYYEKEANYGEMEPDSELTYYYANGFSHPNMWILPQERKENLIPVMWGLIPKYELGENAKEYYKKTIKYGSGLNARSEKLFESNNYKSSALTRRCVIPVDGFYEPHTAPNKFKVPFYFHKKDKGMINLAGIYAVTKDKHVTFTILTREASPLFAKIHNSKKRRPVILEDSKIQEWLSDDLIETDVERLILNDMPDSEFDAYPISKDLYKRGDGHREDIIEKVEYEEIEISY